MSLYDFPHNKRPLIVTDTETTGLNPLIHDMIEIGAIYVDPETLKAEDRFEAKIKVQNPDTFTEKSAEVNGYTEAMWAGASDLFTVMRDFNEFAAEGVMVAQNIAFDYGFILESFRRAKLMSKLDYHTIDVPSIVWFCFPERKSVSLRKVAIDLGIPPEPKIHRAINGAQTCYEILKKLIEMKRTSRIDTPAVQKALDEARIRQ